MNESEFSARNWLQSLTFSADNKEIVALHLFPASVKVCVCIDNSVREWTEQDGRFFKLGVAAGCKLVIQITDGVSSFERRMVVPGRQYIRMASNSLANTRVRILNEIFDEYSIERRSLPFVRYLRDAGFNSVEDKKEACELFKGSSDDTSLELGLLLLGIYENGDSGDLDVKNLILGYDYGIFSDERGRPSIYELSLCDLASCLYAKEVFIHGGMSGDELRSYIQPMIDERLESKEEFGIKDFIGCINLHEFTNRSYVEDRTMQILEDSLHELADLSFDGVCLFFDRDGNRKQILDLYNQNAQSVMSCFLPGIPLSYNLWSLFILLSSFEPSFDLAEQFFSVHSGAGRHGNVINKTSSFLVSDICFRNHGVFGLVALSRSCVITSSWRHMCDDVGEKNVEAEVSVVDSELEIVYNFGKSEVYSTVLYWPQDEFEKQFIEGNWAFGESMQGRIAVYCSHKIVESHNVLINRELEAAGDEVRWHIICSDCNIDMNLMDFSKRIKNEWTP